MVSRLNRKRATVCHPNPPYAAKLGLPPRVCGTHVHTWADNREHVSYSGLWQLPVRRPVLDNLQRLEHMFFWFCDHIGVRIQGDSRRIDPPPQNLFGGDNA